MPVHRKFSAPISHIVGASTLVLILGCGGYGEVTSNTYEYATALYSICNRRDADRLEKFSQKLDEASDAGDVPDQEAQWLAEIVDQARDGDWDKAMVQARRMMTDQIKAGQ